MITITVEIPKSPTHYKLSDILTRAVLNFVCAKVLRKVKQLAPTINITCAPADVDEIKVWVGGCPAGYVNKYRGPVKHLAEQATEFIVSIADGIDEENSCAT